MVMWGVIWGGVLALLTVPNGWDGAWLVGAALGAAAGWTLRKAIHQEMAAALRAAQAAVPLPMQPLPEPPNVAPSAPAESLLPDFKDTEPAPIEPMKPPSGVRRPSPPKPDPVGVALHAARAWLLGGNTVVRMGVLVLFVGLAFLAKYAIDHALLPPELRLAAIGATGVGLFVFGTRLYRRRSDRSGYALTLQGAGVAVLYLTVFAAFRLYQFLPATAAFGVLGLVCVFSTAIALLQNTLPMAFIGFAGAFATPILVSTGQGSHVGLFSYYLLLGIAIAAVAWLRAWRALNLLGFVATFGVATLWGALKYQSELLASTEPFLLAFFALYLAASVWYATRHGLRPAQAIDGTLVFGLPLAAFGLQASLVRPLPYATAFSALAMGAIYMALAWWALRRKDQGVGRGLAECFIALGLGFATLAVPLALDARWTSAVWAVEGAAVYGLGQRQGRWLARWAGLALQVLAAMMYLGDVQQGAASAWPLANPSFIGAVLLAGSALAVAHRSRGGPGTHLQGEAAQAVPAWAAPLIEMEQGMPPVWFWVGFLWWQFAWFQEIERATASLAEQGHGVMLVWLVSAWGAHHLALPQRERPWAIAATPAWLSLPLMGVFALQGMVELEHVFQSWGWLAWPLALVLHGLTLRRLDALPPQPVWSWAHSGGVWLVALLSCNWLRWAVHQLQLQGTSWASVVLQVSLVAVLLSLSHHKLYQPQGTLRNRWPLNRFAHAYLWRAALPLAFGVSVGALVLAVQSAGNAHPLPYVPVLNPTDLTVALSLLACSTWITRVRRSDLAAPPVLHNPKWDLALAGLAFVAINTVWLRMAHHWAHVPWRAEALFESFLVQAGYSILWTVLALVLMVLAHRRHARPVWMGGAALLGLTVAKLFLVDLSNRGGSERIVAFIAVGVMMLVVGYFAPIPPTASASSPHATPDPDPAPKQP
jgi:uncharacterized membrane protein